jgi:hypothetical protein
MTIAIDFDGTLVRDEYPRLGPLQPDALRCVNRLYGDGHYIIIWTCRTGDQLLAAVNHLLALGVKFHRVNSGKPGEVAAYGGEGKKVAADVYVDDRQVGGLPPWRDIYEIISGKNHAQEHD